MKSIKSGFKEKNNNCDLPHIEKCPGGQIASSPDCFGSQGCGFESCLRQDFVQT